MEVAPFLVDFHHFLSICTIYALLSRFTHFFRKFFLAKIAISATKVPFWMYACPPLSPFPLSVLNAPHSLLLTLLPHPPPPDRAQTVSCLDAAPTTISHKRQQILIPPQTWSTFHDTSITSTIVWRKFRYPNIHFNKYSCLTNTKYWQIFSNWFSHFMKQIVKSFAPFRCASITPLPTANNQKTG